MVNVSAGRARWRVHLAWGVAAVVAVTATWWAASAVLHPAIATAPELPSAEYTVTSGQVGVETSATGRVVFSTVREAIAGRSGVVTAISLPPGGEVNAGDVVLTIDLTPVVVAEGPTPAFRGMTVGDRGPDVSQLRAFLGVADGDVYDQATYDAVREWERSLGVAVDGVIERGDLLFVPTLPARAFVDEGLAVGTPIDAGQPVITVVGAPKLQVLADPGGRFTAGMTATVALSDATLTGVLTGPTLSEDGLHYFDLVDEEGRSPCDAACAAQFPVTGPSPINASVAIVPVAEGLVVPDTALVVLPAGGTAVRTADGDLINVTVGARGQGTSIIEGVDEGTVIELFAEPEPVQ